MHLANHLLQLHHRKLSVTVLNAMLLFASAACLAAGPKAATAPVFSTSLPNERAMGLKLDLGLAMSGDGYKGDYADSKHVAAPGAAPTPTVPTELPASSWEVVPADKTLNTSLARWAAVAGWQLVWELPVDYAVSVRTEIRGNFVEAVGLVAKAMETAEIPMKAIFYEGNRVLRIVAKGAE